MYRVLVVDDEVLVREAMCNNIKWNELGYSLAGNCDNGMSAIEFLKCENVDVVLTDICMPYVDGMELSEYIYNNHKDISIIIFSGFDEFEYAKRAIKYSVEEYLLKPITAHDIGEVLTRLREKLDMRKRDKEFLNNIRSTIDIVGSISDTDGNIELKNSKEDATNKGLLIKAYEYIECNYYIHGLSLQDVCSHLGMSISRFSVLFKEEYGETFLELLTRVRMDKAKELIKHGNLKIYEVADKVGFRDPHYFGVAFKKLEGVTPKEWERRCYVEEGYL